MEGGSSSDKLQSIQDTIRSSDVVENRIELVRELGDLSISEKSESASLAECLTDYTCLDVNQCMLNKAILHVAVKYVESDISNALAQVLALRIKVSIWCGKHVKMTLMSSEESQAEEHGNLFFEFLRARFPVSVDKLSVDTVEKFLVEQLNLIKDSISEIKRIQSFESVGKVTLEVLDAVIRLCGAYDRAVDWDSWEEKLEMDKSGMEFEGHRCKVEILDSLFKRGSCTDAVSGDMNVIFGITRKLGWFLDILIDEEVYSSILLLQVPVLYGSGETVEVVWQPMFSSLLNVLEFFMLVVSSSPAWRELEAFLLENIFHPHFLCWEIVMELWCFMLRYAEPGTVSGIIGKLCSLLKLVASSESVLVLGSALQKLARSISMLLTFGAQSMVDQVCLSIVSDEGTQSSSVMRLALFKEGFPLNLLSDKLRSITTQRIITDYHVFIENFDGKFMRSSGSGVYGVPVFALSASLQSLKVTKNLDSFLNMSVLSSITLFFVVSVASWIIYSISLSNNDVKTLKLLVSIIHNYKVSSDKLMKDHYCKLLSETFVIISKMKHLYASDKMVKVIYELENLFISGPVATDTQLYECKPNLALFMAGLAHMEINETNESAKLSSLCELYHLLLREHHWVFGHLAITAFGYFSARTGCNELWRFVPENAALSYDLDSGNEATVERFMSEFKIYLEKETALLTVTPCSDQLRLLAREGLTLKEMFQKISDAIVETSESENMEINCEKQKEINGGKQTNKKRKLPDGIRKGMELLESGMKVIVDGLSQWQQIQFGSDELHDKFLTNFSRLEDEIAHLVGLAGND
ncbi:hypothetical protein C1H46_005815 [Malus baccata]|uniref:Uncharacterized protein n=1 Tax=Malus baccata TaxID=106549 RepID=A0A540NBU1_MALBA|nr:hypothetical protein C1H46_005815 [Malus baccata]